MWSLETTDPHRHPALPRGRPQYFLYLELPDSEYSFLLQELRHLFDGRRERPHITLRGPYTTPPDSKLLQRLKEAIGHHRLRVSGVGRFEFGERRVVYMNATSPELGPAWWKPMLPVARHGRNPHITMYEGTDIIRAVKVSRFLRQNLPAVLLNGPQLRLHVRRHADLFGLVASSVPVRLRTSLDSDRILRLAAADFGPARSLNRANQ